MNQKLNGDKPLFISFEKKFPRLYKVVPGLIPGFYTAVTGASQTGKTKFSKEIFVTHSYNYAQENNIDLHIIYFALEESYDSFWLTIEADMLLKKCGVAPSYFQLTGFHKGLTEEMMRCREEVKPEIDKMKKSIHVIDYLSSPFEIDRFILKFMTTVGNLNMSSTRDDEGNITKTYKYKAFKSNTIVQIVFDHIGLLKPDKDQKTLADAMTRLSRNVMSTYTKQLDISVCSIHQQGMSGENLDNMKAGNLKPTQDKLGDCIVIGRDYYVLLGIFNPNKYPIFEGKNYDGYNLGKLGDNFREISVIRNRYGKANKKFPMYFDGKSNYFGELPIKKEKEDINFEVDMEKYYKLAAENAKYENDI